MPNKSVLITGGSQGLGAKLVKIFDDFGWNTTATQAEDSRLPSYMNLLDRGDIYNVAGLFNNGLDVLICSAAINNQVEFSSTEDWCHDSMRTMNVNWYGNCLLISLLLPQLRKNKGIVCAVISDAAIKPMRYSLAYCASKAAMAMSIKVMARELTKQTGITFFGVSPGKMKNTRMSEQIDRDAARMRGWSVAEAREYQLSQLVTGEEADPTQIADLIYELCCDKERAKTLSGAIIPLGG